MARSSCAGAWVAAGRAGHPPCLRPGQGEPGQVQRSDRGVRAALMCRVRTLGRRPVLAVDGKTLRGSRRIDRGRDIEPGRRLLAVIDQHTRVVLVVITADALDTRCEHVAGLNARATRTGCSWRRATGSGCDANSPDYLARVRARTSQRRYRTRALEIRSIKVAPPPPGSPSRTPPKPSRSPGPPPDLRAHRRARPVGHRDRLPGQSRVSGKPHVLGDHHLAVVRFGVLRRSCWRTCGGCPSGACPVGDTHQMDNSPLAL